MDFSLGVAIVALLAISGFVLGLSSAIGWYLGESIFRPND